MSKISLTIPTRATKEEVQNFISNNILISHLADHILDNHRWVDNRFVFNSKLGYGSIDVYDGYIVFEMTLTQMGLPAKVIIEKKIGGELQKLGKR